MWEQLQWVSSWPSTRGEWCSNPGFLGKWWNIHPEMQMCILNNMGHLPFYSHFPKTSEEGHLDISPWTEYQKHQETNIYWTRIVCSSMSGREGAKFLHFTRNTKWLLTSQLSLLATCLQDCPCFLSFVVQYFNNMPEQKLQPLFCVHSYV